MIQDYGEQASPHLKKEDLVPDLPSGAERRIYEILLFTQNDVQQIQSKIYIPPSITTTFRLPDIFL
jgi:hypothetical protein